MPEFISILRWIRDIVYPQLLKTNENVKIVADNMEEVKALNTSIEDGVFPFEKIATTTETIDSLLTLYASDGDTVIVKDINRGGTFIYDATQSDVNNGCTIFDGWVRQYSGAVNVKWFGAVGDGITDDTLSIKKALNHAGKSGACIAVHTGRYLVTRPISVTNTSGKSITLEGVHCDSSEIMLNTGGDGIAITILGSWWADLDGADAAGVRISNIRFSTNNAGVGTGLSITGDSVAGRPRSPIVMEYVQFTSNAGMSAFWDTGTKILDAGMLIAHGCKWTASNTLPSRGLYLDGTAQINSPVHFKLTSCEFTYGGKQIELGDFVEGVYITGCTLIAANYAVYWTPSQGESGLHISNCHMSSKLSNVYLDNVFDFNLTGSLLYRENTANAYYGVRMLNAGRFALSGNVFLGRNAGTVDEYGVYVESSINSTAQGGIISGNSFHNYLKRGVWIGANAHYVTVSESNCYRNCVAGSILNQAIVMDNTLQGPSVKASIIATIAGGTTEEKINVPISTGTFRFKPIGGLISGTGNGSDYTGSYDIDDPNTTTSNAVFTVRRYGGGTLGAGYMRFSYQLFSDEDNNGNIN